MSTMSKTESIACISAFKCLQERLKELVLFINTLPYSTVHYHHNRKYNDLELSICKIDDYTITCNIWWEHYLNASPDEIIFPIEQLYMNNEGVSEYWCEKYKKEHDTFVRIQQERTARRKKWDELNAKSML